MTNDTPNNKDTKEIHDTQLDISANEQGIHLELGISRKRLPLLIKVGGFILSHLLTLGLTLVKLPPLPPIPNSPVPQIEKLRLPIPQIPHQN
jgi:hypothetical protein